MNHASKTAGAKRVLSVVAMASLWLAGEGGTVVAETTGTGINDPEARFRGAPTFDFGVTNVRWEAATPEYSYVTFDLFWSHSWRAKWTEPAATSCMGKDLDVENWDAAWVFVKFLPEKDSKEAQERNHWLHASLDKNPANHVMPAGATNSVKLSDDGSRGMGVFIFRDAVGWGTNDWRNIKLRWNHPAMIAVRTSPKPGAKGGARATRPPSTSTGAGATGGAGGAETEVKFDPAKAAVRAYAIPMVYVPQGPFKVGTGGGVGISRFPDGPALPAVQTEHMPGQREIGSMTDGSWRGGPVVPFLLDAAWNAPAATSSRARRIGAAAGQLWVVLTYVEVGVGGNSIGDPGVLGDEYPTGYDSFYCMKYDMTQGQYVDYLNSLPPDVAAGRACLGSEVACDYPLPRNEATGGLTIKVSRWPGSGGEDEAELKKPAGTRRIKRPEALDFADNAIQDLNRTGADSADEEPKVSERLVAEPKGNDAGAAPAAVRLPPLYSAGLPFRSCSGISREDMYAYAIWAGLRPMAELEFSKARRGARNPVPFENNTGTTNGFAADMTKDWRDFGLPTEGFRRGNSAGGYGSPITVFRVGCFATPTSDRVAAGATYWGILELGGKVVTPFRRDFRGTHGDGSSPAGDPDAPLQRRLAPCDGNADWPKRIGSGGDNYRTWINAEYIGGRNVWDRGRLVVSAENRIKKPAAATDTVSTPSPAAAAAGATSSADERRASTIKVSNVTWETGGKGYSTVSFDLAWDNSWRAKWEEPAEKNVTGRPLRLESRDAAWVFLKFQPTVTNAFAHAMLSPNASDHRVPAGATLDVGLSDDGATGIGVFVYRSAVGSGANDFKNIKLRWIHPGAAAPAKGTPLRAYAIEMVYVPQGAFHSKVPWGETLATIRSPNATEEWGCRDRANQSSFADFPNGYNAFYCAKYAISQGQYADYLNSLAPALAGAACPGAYGINRFAIHCDTNTGVFAADVPGRPCNFLSWSRILNYEAWAGLRPLTDVEYEKACRGPRAVARPEDAWADGLCAPASGIGKDLLSALPDIDAGPSYWGIRGMSLSGCVHEWPGIIFPAKNGQNYRGSHGNGSPTPPPDWPNRPAFGQYGDKDMYHGAVWMTPEKLSRAIALGEFLLFDHTGRYGARAVRTAPLRKDDIPALQLDALPGLEGYDVAIFPLAGRFSNSGGSSVKAEIVIDWPDACFLDGAASRAFTAAPKADTPFRILVAVTRLNAVKAMQGGVLPVQVRSATGEVLGEQTVRLTMDKAPDKPAIIRSFDGGTVEVRILNASDRAVPVSVILDPLPECKPGETERRVEIPAGKDAAVTYPVPRQTLAADGVRGMPFRVTVGQGAVQGGEIAVNLLNQARWWMGRKVKGGRPGAAGATEPGAAAGNIDLPAGSEDKAPEGLPDGFFTMAERPSRWKVAEVGATSLPLNEAGSMPARGCSVLAGTKVFAPAEREVRVKVVPETVKDDVLRLWVNEKVVFESRPAEGMAGKSFLLRAGMNSLAASWRSGLDGAHEAGAVSVTFTDAKTGDPVPGLVLDVEGK